MGLNSRTRKRVDDVVPIVFSFRGEMYHGVFRRIVAYENGDSEYMFITDGVMPIGSLFDPIRPAGEWTTWHAMCICNCQ